MPAGCWMSRFKRVGVLLRQIRGLSRGVMTRAACGAKLRIPCFQEKPLSFSLR